MCVCVRICVCKGLGNRVNVPDVAVLFYLPGRDVVMLPCSGTAPWDGKPTLGNTLQAAVPVVVCLVFFFFFFCSTSNKNTKQKPTVEQGGCTPAWRA